MVTDYLAWAPDDAAMIAGFAALGVWRDGALIDHGVSATGAVWAIDYFRDWLDGETPRPGVYALLRWLPAAGEGPPPTPPGVTLSAVPADCPRHWAD